MSGLRNTSSNITVVLHDSRLKFMTKTKDGFLLTDCLTLDAEHQPCSTTLTFIMEFARYNNPIYLNLINILNEHNNFFTQYVSYLASAPI